MIFTCKQTSFDVSMLMQRDTVRKVRTWLRDQLYAFSEMLTVSVLMFRDSQEFNYLEHMSADLGCAGKTQSLPIVTKLKKEF